MFQSSLRPTAESTCPPFERFAVDACCVSDRGCARPANEDSACVVAPTDPRAMREKGVLAVVADGMGGHEGGEIASRITVEQVRERYYESGLSPDRALAEALQKANGAVFEHACRNPELAGMGTTCTAVAVVNGSAWLAHVGDSRMYLVRDRCAYRMTQDDSAAMELVKRGLLTLAEADRHSERNLILLALGTHPRLDVATWKDSFPLRAGDCLALCSDGLYETIRDDEIAAVCARSGSSVQACDALLRLALERDGSDNITVAILRITPAPEEVAK